MRGYQQPPLSAMKGYSQRGTAKQAAANIYCIDGQYFTLKQLAKELGVETKEVTRRLQLERAKPGNVTMEALRR